MKRVVQWAWNRGILSTFLTGLFAILPLVITMAILFWVASYIHALLNPEGIIGAPLRSIGLQFVHDEVTAWVIGLVVVLVGIWLLGLLMKSVARQRIEKWSNGVVNRIPVVKTIYSTVAQIVGMLNKQDQTDVSSMSVVFCSFGDAHGAGFLGLLASPNVYCYDGVEYHLLYLPTAPIPMYGGLILVPTERVTKIDMSVDQLLRVYLSMGILSSHLMPKEGPAASTSGRGLVQPSNQAF